MVARWRVEKGASLNGTGIVLSCGGVGVSVRVAWGLQEFIRLRAAFDLAWFFAIGAVAYR